MNRAADSCCQSLQEFAALQMVLRTWGRLRDRELLDPLFQEVSSPGENATLRWQSQDTAHQDIALPFAAQILNQGVLYHNEFSHMSEVQAELVGRLMDSWNRAYNWVRCHF